MVEMLKIGVKTIAGKESAAESKELKFSKGEVISARIEKGGNGEAQLNIKGVLIEAKGTGKFSQGEILKLKITGMENGKLIVEKDIKNENLAKKIDRTILKEAITKENIVKEGIFQQKILSKREVDNIYFNYSEIEKKMEQEINKNGDFIKTKLDNDNQIKNRDENINEKFEKVNVVKENAEKTSNEGKNEKILNSVNNNLEKDKILKDIKNENYKDIDEMKKLFKENDKELKTVLKLVKDHVEESWKNSSNQSQNIKEKISKEEKFSKISEFVLKNNGLENNEKKNEVLKTLIKLENSKLGIEPEMFKSIFSFYNKEDLKEMNIDKNLTQTLKEYIKEISENSVEEGTSVKDVNILNKFEDKNILEFFINVPQFKEPAEIRIKEEDIKNSDGTENKRTYLNINIEMEKLGKISVILIVDNKKISELLFKCENEKSNEVLLKDSQILKNILQDKEFEVKRIKGIVSEHKEDTENNYLDLKY